MILSRGRFSELHPIYQGCHTLTFALAMLSCLADRSSAIGNYSNSWASCYLFCKSSKCDSLDHILSHFACAWYKNVPSRNGFYSKNYPRTRWEKFGSICFSVMELALSMRARSKTSVNLLADYTKLCTTGTVSCPAVMKISWFTLQNATHFWVICQFHQLVHFGVNRLFVFKLQMRLRSCHIRAAVRTLTFPNMQCCCWAMLQH